MVSHIQSFVWTWPLEGPAANLQPSNKYCSGNILEEFKPITPGEVIIYKYLINNVSTNVLSGGSYNKWPVITTFTDNQDGTWFVEVWHYTTTKPAKQISERVY